MSSGAYYRQLKQCRDKVSGLLYSMVLLQAIGVIDPQAPAVLARVAEQISVMFDVESSDILDKQRLESVMSVMDQTIKRMYRL